MIFRRRRFGDLIERQLALFEERARRAPARRATRPRRPTTAAERDEAEERYGDYVDLVDTGTELLAGIRDAYAATLDEDTAARYEDEFNRTAARRLPQFALELGDT